jgi:hypothetical protein
MAAQEYTEGMGILKRTALNYLKHFTELGLIDTALLTYGFQLEKNSRKARIYR